MIDQQINAERDRLVGWWQQAFARRADWTSFAQIASIVSIVNGNPTALKSKEPVRYLLRSFHNKLGYMAGYGGLCDGAIFRTQSFITEARPRIGSKQGQTVHIEHTVPICVLDTELRKRRLSDHTETLAWLLKHSVATAFLKSDEKKYLKGVARTTDAFEHNRPFLRYKELFADGGVVWNVFDGEKIDHERFTFEDHIDVIVRVLNKVGAGQNLIRQIEPPNGARPRFSQPAGSLPDQFGPVLVTASPEPEL